MTNIYDYGWAAWIWRILLAGALLGATAMCVLGFQLDKPFLFLIAVVLAAPSLFFGSAVATRIDQFGEDRLLVETLLFWQRRLTSSQLGRARLRKRYESETGSIYAPAVWVSVQGSYPIYLDLLAHIPDRALFAKIFRVPLQELPAGEASSDT